jgi:hypothetical protein
MTLPLAGSPLSLSQVNTENGYGTSAVVSLNDNSVRSLAGKLSGIIGFNDLQGKSNDGLTAAYYFDGVDSGVKINNTPTNSANLTFGTSDFTIEFWMKADTNQSTYSTILDSSTDNSAVGIGIGSNIGGTPNKLNFYAQGGVSTTIKSANNVTDNTWKHIACVKYANTGMLFVNGVKEANTDIGAWSTVTNAYVANGQIGRSTFGSGDASDNTYTGWLSNLRIVKDRALYTTNFTPPTLTLAPVPNTELLTLKSGNIVDESGKSVTLTSKTVAPQLTVTEIPSILPTFPVTISSSISNANVYTIAKNAGWDANNGLVVVTINSGVTISSASTGAYAMEIPNYFYGGLKLLNNGTIVGRGGNGGNGGTATAYNSGSAGTAGTAGGPALFTASPVRISNTGRIAGGGGGAGGGGSTGGQYTSGSGKSAKTVSVYSGGGGGGGGIGVSTGGSAGGGQGTAGAGSAGTLTAAGAGGVGGTSNYVGGSGGTGGSYGSSGANGGQGTGNTFKASGGAGAAAGSAIVGYSKVTWLFLGTVNGATSG